MNKELEQEIKNSQNLPRRERRKKVLELQKKYSNKTIITNLESLDLNFQLRFDY